MAYVHGYIEPATLPRLLGQANPYGPGGTAASWWNIAQSHWDRWNRAYGDCPEWQDLIAAINRSRGRPEEGAPIALRRGLQSPLVIGQPIPQEWFGRVGYEMWSEVVRRGRGAQRACDDRRAQEAAGANGNGVVTGQKAQQLIAFNSDPIYNDPPPDSWGQCFDVEHPGGQISRICVPAREVVEQRRAQEAADREAQIKAREQQAPPPENGEPMFSDKEWAWTMPVEQPEEREVFGPGPEGVEDLLVTDMPVLKPKNGAQPAQEPPRAGMGVAPWLLGAGALLALWGMAYGATRRG